MQHATLSLPAEATPAATHPTTCLNCDVPLTGRYCADCGQPAATHRITVKHLLHDIPHSIWHVDKGILFTLRELLLRPGPMLLGYLRGQRARHFAPISLLLLVTGISSFVALQLHLTDIIVEQQPTEYAELQATQGRAAETIFHYMGWIYVAVTPLVALLVRRLLRRASINWAEAMIVVLYVTAASNLLSLLMLPAYHLVTSHATYLALTMSSLVVVVLYQTYAYAQMLHAFRPSALGRWWRALVVVVAGYLLVLTTVSTLTIALSWRDIGKAVRHRVEAQRAAQRPAASH